MKIAVYGHSFAVRNLCTPHKAWFDLLGERLGATSVSPLGKAGSSVFDAYKNFLKNYKNYDLNIFLVAQYGQYTKEVNLKLIDGQCLTVFPSSLNAVESMLSRADLIDESIDELNKIKSWFTASVPEYEMLIRELILRDIETVDPRVILISGGGSDPKNHVFGNDLRKKNFRSGVDHYWTAQINFFKNPPRAKERPTIIQTHFTPNATKMFADAAYQYITTGEWPVPPELIEDENPVDYYYELNGL